MSVELFEKINSNRKSWTPVTPNTPESVSQGAEDTISRCLAARLFELPVKDFINQGLSRPDIKAIGQAGVETLIRNTEDEEKHDVALNNCVSVYSQYDPKYEKVAQQLLAIWKEHPDHPILKAAVLENGIFFVILPIFRQWGGTSLRNVSMDISSDEINHVQSHRLAAKLLGQKPSKSLDDLRKATVQWLVESFNVPEIDKSRFTKASDQLMYKGITDQLEFSQNFTVPAFFERSNSQLSYY